MATVQQVNIQCECHHRHGPLFLLRPWAWGGPCRRCERMMERNVVVVPAGGGAVAISRGRRRSRRATPIVVSTTTQAVNVPQPVAVAVAPRPVAVVTPAQTALDWQTSQEAYPSALPPKYNELMAAC